MTDSDIILDCINKRSSTRIFKDKKIEFKRIEKIIKSAFAAPSAANLQPWEYIIVTDDKKVRKMKEVHEYAGMFETAKAAIIVCGNLDKVIPAHKEFWVQDCSAATQNILLSANALGIGSVWTGIYLVAERCKKLSDYFNLPSNIMPFSLIALGYPEKTRIQNKYDDKKVHINKW